MIVYGLVLFKLFNLAVVWYVLVCLVYVRGFIGWFIVYKDT
jgi:hypothetical protein